MTLQEIIDLTWIPILAFALSFCAGVHMLIIKKRPPYLKTKDDHRAMKDEKKYAEVGGRLLLFFAVGAAVMVGLLFISAWAAFTEIVLVFLIFAKRWKEMNDAYGPM